MSWLLFGIFCTGWLGQVARGDAATTTDGTVTTAPPATLSAQDLLCGREQVQRVLDDRPQLREIVQVGNPIDDWLVKAFAAPDLKYKLVWQDAETSPLSPSAAANSPFPDATNISRIWVDAYYKSGPHMGDQRPAEEILRGLVFGLNNARQADENVKLDRSALLGEMARDDYIVAHARCDYRALQATVDFYNGVWIPFCKPRQLAYSPALWNPVISQSFEGMMASSPPGTWYPWGYFGGRYDRIVATEYHQALLKAQSGLADAQARVAMLDFYSRAYEDAARWFLKAANQGNLQAQRCLVWLYDNGEGVPLNHETAFSWCLTAAQQGDIRAEQALAYRYQKGIGVAADQGEAKKWLRQMANGDRNTRTPTSASTSNRPGTVPPPSGPMD